MSNRTIISVKKHCEYIQNDIWIVTVNDLSPVTASSRIIFPPGFSTRAISAKVSELWTVELSARTQDTTQSKVDGKWAAGGEKITLEHPKSFQE